MKLFSVIKPYKAIMLDEARLSTEFKIGFELEGICVAEDMTSGGDYGLPGYHSHREAEGNAKKLLDRLNEKLGLGEGHIESDSSVNPSGTNVTASGHEYNDRARTEEGGHRSWGFEYVSPIIPFIPKNINKMVNFLKGLKDIGVVTNDHCGFHTHISYPDMTREDVAWLLYCVANDESLFKEVTELDEGDYKINFFSHYASKEILEKLRDLDLDSRTMTLNTDNKYQVMRIHPQGTIEWRGPRNFINDGSAEKDIEDYIKKLYRLIVKIGDIVTRKEYNGVKREDVLKRVSVYGNFNTDVEQKKQAKADNIYNSIIKNPAKFLKAAGSTFTKLFTPELVKRLAYNSDFLDYLKTAKEDAASPKGIIDACLKLVQKDWSSEACSVLNAWMKPFDKMNGELSVYLMSGLLPYEYRNWRSFLRDNWNKLIIKDPEILQKCLKLYMKVKDDQSDAKYLLNLIGANSKYLDMSSFMLIAKNDISLLRMFDNVPKKVQRVITRRNPYAIQYINDPDPLVVDELIKKHGDEIKDYILEKV